MSEDPVLAAIAKLGDDLRGEIGELRTGLMTRMDRLQASVAGIRDDLTVLGGANDRIRLAGQNTHDEARAIANSLANIERVLLKHSARLDHLERRP